MPRNKPFPAITKAIRTAAEQLARMPSSPEVLSLKSVMSAIQEEVDGWAATAPAAEKREGVMKRVLAVHLAITRLARPKR
jgi:hypothetical protein